ncbi:MAG TPA: HEAT repeat domain-containing protein [Gemmatimonadales bacterium]|jgi:HEAT repeat protein
MRPLFFALPLLVTSLAAQAVPVAPVAPRAPMPPPVARAPLAADVYRWDAQRYNIDAQAYSSINLDYSSDLAMAQDRLFEAQSSLAAAGFGDGISYGGGPVAWAHQDPADSLYRNARDLLNRGDYRKAAALFKSLPQQFPSSAYVGDAQYWQAFALYRIGGTPELQDALTVLASFSKTAAAAPAADSRAPRAADRNRDRASGSGSSTNVSVAPAASSGFGRVTTNSYDVNRLSLSYSFGSGRAGSTQTDATALAARIATVLSSRGMADNAAVKAALAAGGNSCDQEDQSVRAEALSALMQNDPETARQMASKILGNRDDCSVPLRRNALMLLANRDDAATTTVLIGVAKNDPSSGIRMEAMQYLVRRNTPAGTDAVLQILHSSTDAEVQRAAASALAASSDPRVRTELRTLIENNSADESLRVAALHNFERDKLSADDATWLRNFYAHSNSTVLKSRIISLLAISGGEANNQWLTQMIRNDDEPMETRRAALMRMGGTMDITALTRLYDASSQRPIREAVLELLSERKEPEALDKVVDIAKNGTDPAMRRTAIGVLARSKDPRAAKLLLQLVDK